LSRGRPGGRGAAAGIALAAAGVIYSRLTGRRPTAPEAREGLGEPPLEGDSAPTDEVERARSDLADELARRAGDGAR
jgi:hypothetical protein